LAINSDGPTRWKTWSKEKKEKGGMHMFKFLSETQKQGKEDLRGLRCFECSGFGHIRANCENLKQGKGKAYNATLSDESEEKETPALDQFLAFVVSHEDEEDSY
jgi:hypothetical protein